MNNLSECNQNVKKAFLNVLSENIPSELKKLPQWVNWRGVWKPDKGKWDKVPFQPDGSYAKTNDPSTWYPFETVASRNGQFDGIGFVLTKESGIIGFDFDHCIENNVISSEVQTVIDILNSYTEKSPSGTGIRIFCSGKLPAGIRKNTEKGYECYDSGRYLTLTGHHIEGTPLTVEKRQNEVRKVHSGYFKKPEKPLSQQPSPVISTPLTTQELLEKAFQSANGDKIQRLFNGGWSDYASQSEADLALCCCLAFWFDRNESDIDSVFRQSGLFRDKWDTKHRADGATYGQITVSKAVADTSETYQQHCRTHKPAMIPSESGLTSQQILEFLNDDEEGDAYLFAHLFRDRFIFDSNEKGWYIWKNHYWESDKTESVYTHIQDITDIYLKEAENQSRLQIIAAKEGHDKRANQHKQNIERLLKRVRTLRLLNRKSCVVSQAKKSIRQPLVTDGEQWDSKPMQLPCRNGIVDLKTGELHAGKREDFVRTFIPYEYDPKAECPNWEKFLSEIFNHDSEIVSFIQRLFGYAISGKVRHHIFPIFYGKGRNGKGTMFFILHHVLGKFAHKTNAELLLEQKNTKGHNAETHALWGKRLVYASETSEGRQFNVSKVKELVGGDILNARLPYAERAVEFTPTHLLILMTNHKPRVYGDDFAFWERIVLVPFSLSFVDRQPTSPDERKADTELEGKLKAEAQGILNWLIQGCINWQKQGLNPPDSVRTATEEYRQEEDIIGIFLSECCETDNLQAEEKASDIYKAYQAWATERSEKPMTQTRFGKEMKKRFDSYKSTKGYFFYIGIRLLND